MIAANIKLKRNILWPFVLGSALLFAVLLISVYREERGHIEEDFTSIKDSVADVLGMMVRDRAQKLSVAIDVLQSDPRLANALVARDRAQLLQLSRYKFARLQGALGVTHLYFHDPSLVNFLRVHKPEIFGDTINRYTAREAAESGKLSYGAELGPLGTFTLRIVVPWHYRNRLIGYIELGEQVDGLTDTIASMFKVDVTTLILKQYINQVGAGAADSVQGRSPARELKQEVVAYETRPLLAESRVEQIAERLAYHRDRVEFVTLGGRNYLIGMVPLLDVAQHTIGRMLVARDMTTRAVRAYDVILTMGTASLLVGPILIMLFYLVLDRAERQLGLWRTRVVEESGDRIRMQQAHILDLEHGTLYDGLTGLPNRKMLHEQLSLAIKTSASAALVLLNIRGISEINDALSHEIGDGVLSEVAERLRTNLSHAIAVARPGGDEFAVVLPNVGRADIFPTLESIESVLAPQFHMNEVTLDIAANFGVALYPEHGSDAATLLRRADAAMRQSKKTGQNATLYDRSLDSNSLRRLNLLSDLRSAIVDGDLELYYQPQVSMSTQHVVAAEALLRWHHPIFGVVAPTEFIPLAEHSGMIRPLTRWVLNRALSDHADWRRNGLEIGVCVNLSANDLTDTTLPDYVEELLAKWKAKPRALVLELTESAVVHDPERALKVLHRFAMMGVALSVDDFGTGYSSLAYLKQMPVVELKVDRSFVADMTRNADDAKIVASTINLAHTLGLTVVAEGVEEQSTWERLTEMGCDRIQGDFISRPLPAASVGEWITMGRWSARRAASDVVG